MDFYDIKTHWGSVSTAAKALGKGRQSVYRWKDSGVPLGEQYRIQVLTNGALQAQPEQQRSGLAHG